MLHALCDAEFGNIFRWDGEVFHHVSAHIRRSLSLKRAVFCNRHRPDPTTPLGRMVASR